MVSQRTQTCCALSFSLDSPGISPMPSRLLNLLSPLRCLALLALTACSPATPPVHVHNQIDPARITVSDAWINQPPPGAAVAGAYLRLANPGPDADRLLGVDTEAAERVEIHEMKTVSGMMQMRPLEHGLALPAGETVHLAPGGLHLMLIAPKMELTPGGEVSMNLTFEHAPAQTVMFQVRSLMETEDAHPHHQHRHNGR